MKTILISVLFFISALISYSQNKILVYHETNQFRHGSINAGISMFEDLGNENNDWTTDNSQDSSVFTATNLAQYDVVVFLNTSGNDESGSDGDLLSGSEKLALENFIISGKGFIGVHAATDTYRDGVWPFYNELVGAIVQTQPNHTANNYNADMEVITSHPIVDFLGAVGAIWNKNEEYYYWEQNGGQLSTDNTVLLEVEQTGSETYDAARPVTWYKESITYDDDSNAVTDDITISGLRSFYTANGHNNSDYNSDSNFRTLMKNATIWAIGEEALNIEETNFENLKVFPNPVEDYVSITIPKATSNISIAMFNQLGQLILNTTVAGTDRQEETYKLNLENFEVGNYIVKLSYDGKQDYFKLIKK
jgi:type 1 glutamine amidotransferase